MRTLLHSVGLALALTTLAPALMTGCAGDSAGEDVANVAEAKGAFELFVGNDGQHYFRLVAANGEKVLQSEGYVRRSGALAGVESVKVNGMLPERYEVLEAVSGELYFHIVAANGQIIGRSEMYVSRSNADRGAATVRDILTSMQPVDSDEKVRGAIELAAEGATFTSEGDYPYSYVAAELSNAAAPITIELVRDAIAPFVDADPDADKPLADLYAMEASWSEWATSAASCAEETDEFYRELCVEQAELDEVLAANLTDISVFYFGAYGAAGRVDGIAVSIIVVGRTPAGNLAGVRTIAIWT